MPKDWRPVIAAAREYIAELDDLPTFPQAFSHLVERGLCTPEDSRKVRMAFSNAIRRGKLPRLPSSFAEWPPVIAEARRLIGDGENPPTFRELCDELVERGLMGDHQRISFRNAMSDAQRQDKFPQLAPGSTSSANQRTPHEIHQERRLACARYLAEAVERRGEVHLNPRTMRGLADAGFGAFTVAYAVAILRDRGLVRIERGGHVVLRERQEELAAA